MRNKTKFSLIFVAIALIAVALFGAFSKIDSLQTSRKLTSSDYAVGAIAESGKIVESKQAFYTKDLMELDGSEIKLEEDATISYKVFFYDEDGKFISSTETLTEDLESSSIPENAKYFRVMVTPSPIDGEAVVCEFMNRGKYVNQISIVVGK